LLSLILIRHYRRQKKVLAKGAEGAKEEKQKVVRSAIFSSFAVSACFARNFFLFPVKSVIFFSQQPIAESRNIMHEMGIAMQVAEIATASIPADMKDARIERINLKVGKLAAVVPESLRFCFEIIAKDTPLAGVELHIEEIPVIARCRECDTQWTITGPVFTCQKCQSGSIEIISGQELDIESIEIADS